MPANTNRREDARKQAEKIAAKQASADNRTRNILMVVIAAVVALLIVAGVIIYQASQKTLLSDFEGTAPASATEHGGIPFGEGGEVGGASDGPTVQVYVDFMCPACGSFEAVNGEDLTELVEAGTIELVYHPLNFLNRFSQGTAYSTRSANAFLTVAEESPEHALDFVAALFADQPAENTPGLTDEELANIAVETGVPQEVADTFADLTYGEWIDVASEQATRDGVGGTPSVFIDGTELDTQKYNWSQPGVLRDRIEELAG